MSEILLVEKTTRVEATNTGRFIFRNMSRKDKNKIVDKIDSLDIELGQPTINIYDGHITIRYKYVVEVMKSDDFDTDYYIVKSNFPELLVPLDIQTQSRAPGEV